MIDTKDTWQDLGIDDDEMIEKLKDQKFIMPSKVQAAVLRKLEEYSQDNILVEAPTGAGKTLAYLLAAYKRIDSKKQKSQVIIIAHTVVLCEQIAAVAKLIGLQVQLCLGQGEHVQYKENQQVVVATPKAFISNFCSNKNRGGAQAARFSPSDFQVAIFDEADYYFDYDNGNEIKKIIETLPKRCQKLLFSATLDEKKKIEIIKQLFKKESDNVQKINIKVDMTNYQHIYVTVKSQEEKLQVIQQIFDIQCLEAGFQGIIFCKTKKMVDQIYKILQDKGISASQYHSDLTKEAQKEQYEKFNKGNNSILITTDMFSRGVDIKTMALVINFDLPVTKVGYSQELEVSPITYVHRTGRAGRFARKGVCLTLVEDNENSKKDFKKIEDFVKQKYDQDNIQFKECKVESLVTDINKILSDYDKKQLKMDKQQQNQIAQVALSLAKEDEELKLKEQEKIQQRKKDDKDKERKDKNNKNKETKKDQEKKE